VIKRQSALIVQLASRGSLAVFRAIPEAVKEGWNCQMKIAGPLFGDRISPHFGASSEILLVEARGMKVTTSATIHVGTVSPEQMARRIASLGVDKVICGGIETAHKQWLNDNDIEVVDNQKGSAQKRLGKLIAQETIA
jgi:predicted Fe-Mo cluster-binding NifX family protein